MYGVDVILYNSWVMHAWVAPSFLGPRGSRRIVSSRRVTYVCGIRTQQLCRSTRCATKQKLPTNLYESDAVMKGAMKGKCGPVYTNLVNTRQNNRGHLFLVLNPIFTILAHTLVFIPWRTVNQENGNVDQVEVRKHHPPSSRFTLH